MATPKTILLVEDDVDLRDILQDILESEGYEVVPAYDGRQALEYLRAPRAVAPHAVVLDLVLPLVSGWGVLDAYGKELANRGIPVIVISAVDEGRPAEASDFFKKPFSLGAFLTAVQQRVQDTPP